MNLASKYRPSKFEDVIGQKSVTFILSKMVEKDQVPSALLFSGPKGVGKTSTARILASAVNDTEDHPAVLEIDGASNGLVGDIRALKEDLQYFVEGIRVVIIDEAHSMSREAFNALLKMLEEPPPGTIFVLVTTEYHKIPATVMSRCIRFDFKRASAQSIYAKLATIAVEEIKDFSFDADILTKISKEADGSFRDAIMLLERCLVADIHTMEAFNEFFGEADYAPSLLAAAMEGTTSVLKALETAFYSYPVDDITDKTVELLRDLLILKSQGEIVMLDGEPGYAIRTKLANLLSAIDIVQCLKLLWNLRLRMNTGKSDNNLRLCYTMISEVLTGKISTPKKSEESGKRLTLDDI